MGRTRNGFGKESKAKAVREVLNRGRKNMTELSGEFSVHATQMCHIVKSGLTGWVEVRFRRGKKVSKVSAGALLAKATLFYFGDRYSFDSC